MNTFLEKRHSIAIVGTRISGLGIAYLLYPHHKKIYEKNDYLGGAQSNYRYRYTRGKAC